jgi:pimeloyl-ACP methyl ester carboxylesterase
VRHLVLVGAPGMGLRTGRLPLTSWREQATEEGQRAAHRRNLATLMLHDDAAIDELAVSLQAANVPRDRMHRRRLALTDVLLPKLPGLSCAVDAIYGAHDALYVDVLDRLEPVLRSAPGFGELVIVPGAGHWLQYEAPEVFHRELLRLLAARR